MSWCKMEKIGKKWDFFNKLLLIICIILLFYYYYCYDFTHTKNMFFAALCLGLNFHIVFKCRHNQPLFLFAIMLLYFNYSGFISYYFFEHSPFITFEQCNTVQIKGIAIIGICFFTLLLDFFVEWERAKSFEIISDSVNGKIGYYVLVIAIVSICLYYIYIRGENGTSYIVANLPIFEYSYLLFIVGIFFAQGDRKRQYLLIAVLFMDIFVDAYYGGRITLLQVALVFFTMFLYKWFTKKQIILGLIGGVLLLSLISIYRRAYSLSGLSFNTVLSYVTEGRFAADSAANALYTTFGAIKIHDFYALDYRIEHFFGFLLDIVLGSEVNGYLPLQSLIINSGIYHIGGGWNIGYVYFWFGMPGIVLYSIIVVFIIRKLFCPQKPSVLKYFYSIVIIVSMPRWYLYTPAAVFRSILIISMLYFLIHFFINIRKFKILGEKEGKRIENTAS